MAQTTTHVTLDVSKQSRIQVIMAKQYDTNSRLLRISMTDNGHPIDIPGNCNVVINASRSDYSTRTFAGSVDGNSIIVPITNWMMELDGKVLCDASIIEGDERLSTLNFIVAVEKSNSNGGGVSEDDENYDVLLSLISDVQKLHDSCSPVHIRFSAYPDGTDYTDTKMDGQYYIGIAKSLDAPADKSGYSWCEFVTPESSYIKSDDIATIEDVKMYLNI